MIALDSEHELEDLCGHLGGCFLDLLSGQYRINLLEPRRWDDGSEPEDPDAPPAFRGTLLAQHISFLRDIFRVYKGFDTPHIDTLELMIERLYQQWGISDETDLSQFGAMNYPVMTDLYDLIERTYQHYDQESLPLYPPEMLRDLLLGLHSMCKGADFRFSMVTPISHPTASWCSVSRAWMTWRRIFGIRCCSMYSPICQTGF